MASARAFSTLECYSLSSAEFDALGLRQMVAWTRQCSPGPNTRPPTASPAWFGPHLPR